MSKDTSKPKKVTKIILHDHQEAYQDLWERFVSKRYTKLHQENSKIITYFYLLYLY